MKHLVSGIIVVVLASAIFSACSASSGQYAPSSAPAADAASPPPAAYEQEASDFTYDESTALPLLTPSNEEGKKMVYTVNLSLQTTTFETGTRKLLNVVGEMGGYVQSAFVEGHSLYEPDVDRFAKYTVRIPSENLAAFLTTMEDNYNLWRLEQESQDITAQHQQTDTRLADLREQEERLRAAIAEVEDTKERLSLERQLTEVQVAISSLGASQGAMDRAVLYSTVTIQLYEVNLADISEAPEDTFMTKLGKTTNNSLYGFIAFCQNVLLFLIAALPVFVVLAVLAAIVFLVLRFWRKRGRRITQALTGKSENKKNAPVPQNYPPDQPGPYDGTPKQ